MGNPLTYLAQFVIQKCSFILGQMDQQGRPAESRLRQSRFSRLCQSRDTRWNRYAFRQSNNETAYFEVKSNDLDIHSQLVEI